ncbi:hypothetical protein BJ741DRAFT_638958, partial [Chytriomyces cf. hyalinus JEL632]
MTPFSLLAAASLLLAALVSAQGNATTTAPAAGAIAVPCVSVADCVTVLGAGRNYACNLGVCSQGETPSTCSISSLSTCDIKQPLVIGLILLGLFIGVCCLPSIICCFLRGLFCFATKTATKGVSKPLKTVARAATVAGGGTNRTIARSGTNAPLARTRTNLETYNPKTAYANHKDPELGLSQAYPKNTQQQQQPRYPPQSITTANSNDGGSGIRRNNSTPRSPQTPQSGAGISRIQTLPAGSGGGGSFGAQRHADFCIRDGKFAKESKDGTEHEQLSAII